MMKKNTESGQTISKDKTINFGLAGGVLILVGIVLEQFSNHSKIMFFQSRTILGCIPFFKDIGIAFLSAAVIAYLIEIPNLVTYFKDRIVEALKDYNYLKGLSIIQLEDIKKNCNSLIFVNQGKRTEQYLNESLIDFENEIFSLLAKPFYEYYKTTITCKDFIDGDINSPFAGNTYLSKKSKTNFKIVNPLKGERSEKIFPSLNIYCPKNVSNCEKLIIVTKLLVKVDNGEFKDYTDKITITSEDIKNNKHPNYNKRISYKMADDDFRIHFKNELTVEVEETRYITISDPVFSKRMDKPTKNLTINYLYDNADYKLKAECFGTLSNMTNGNLIKTENEYSVFVESLSWLLPGNGIIIAIIPNERVQKVADLTLLDEINVIKN